MKTRTELWKEYREKIEKNIQLESAIQSSDKKLKILYGRLTKAFPEYKNEFKKIKKDPNLQLKEIDHIVKYDLSNIRQVIETINEAEKDYSSLSSIDKLNFSSKELDGVIQEIKKGKLKNADYVNQGSTKDIEITTKNVNLGVTNMKINIAIDGPSGSGKSSAAKLVAEKFGLKYINTGLVYRAIALLAIDNGLKEFSGENIGPLLKPGIIELLENEVVYLKGIDITKEVRSDIVSQTASKVAAITEVRKYALEIMQDAAKHKGIVMDGRDITFRVLPNAELKFFIDTKPEVRADRRLKQNEKLGYNTDYDVILKEIKERDHRDRTRSVDPLHIVPDAILIDSSEMTLEEVVDNISKEILKKRKG